VGEEAIKKGLKYAGVEPPKGDNLFAAALAGDIVSNALYYSAIGIGGNKHLLLRGVASGLSAGIGALTLTKPMGLSDAPITKTTQTKVMTVAWYLLGGVVTALTIKALRR
jgi:alkylation response protein AidB-like acyl-CoA dehydrogenase